jgi:hypothetical protein
LSIGGYDYAKRQGLNAMFGDAVTGQRQAEIQIAWQYGQDNITVRESTAGTGAISYADQMINISTGSGVGSATAQSVRRLRYQASFDGYAMFTSKFSEPQEGTAQRIGLYDDNNGFFVQYTTSGFHLVVRRGGVDRLIPMRPEFWVSTDLTKLNIWRITYAYLGTGPVVLEQYISTEAGWLVVAKYDDVGSLTEPHVAQPSLPWRAGVVRSSGSGDPVVLSSASVGCGRIGAAGDIPSGERKFSTSNEKTISSNTLTNVITIRVGSTFKGVDSGVEALITYFSAASDGTKSVRFKMFRNATLGGTPNFVDIDTNGSVTSYDVDGTTVTGGRQILTAATGRSGQLSEVLSLLMDIRLEPGDDLTLAAESTGASDVIGALTWKELF